MKNITLTLLVLTFSLSASAALKMKPGKWRIEMQMKNAKGETTNPSAHMQEAFAKMPPEQRKRMEEMMSKMGKNAPKVGYDQKGMTVCY